MKLIKNVFIILALLVVMSTAAVAHSELPDPGITPDSPFYFLDTMFDVFKSPENKANERAAEIVAMAEKGHEKGLAKATERYMKAMEKRTSEAEENENASEEVTLQYTNHLEALLSVREKVPESAWKGLDRAINQSASGREDALETLEQQNPERARVVAQETLLRVMNNTPQEAQEGLQRALEAVQRGDSRNIERNESEENQTQNQTTQGIPSNIPSSDDGEMNSSESDERKGPPEGIPGKAQ